MNNNVEKVDIIKNDFKKLYHNQCVYSGVWELEKNIINDMCCIYGQS